MVGGKATEFTAVEGKFFEFVPGRIHGLLSRTRSDLAANVRT